MKSFNLPHGVQPPEPDNKDAQEILRALRLENDKLRARLDECRKFMEILIRRIAEGSQSIEQTMHDLLVKPHL